MRRDGRCSRPYFLTERNLTNLGFQASFVAVLALGQLLVILTRGIDLSVGSVVGLAGVLGIAAGASGAGDARGRSSPPALAVGLVNGGVLVWGRVAEPVHRHARHARHRPRPRARGLRRRRRETGLPAVVGTLGSGTRRRRSRCPVLLVAALAALRPDAARPHAVGPLDLRRRRQPGRRAPRRASRPTRVLLSVYVLCGPRRRASPRSSSPGAPTRRRRRPGQLLELDAITAVIIGGASFLGGRGRVVNVIAGALIIGVIRNGLDLLDVSPFWQLIAIGMLVIVSLELDVAARPARDAAARGARRAARHDAAARGPRRRQELRRRAGARRRRA